MSTIRRVADYCPLFSVDWQNPLPAPEVPDQNLTFSGGFSRIDLPEITTVRVSLVLLNLRSGVKSFWSKNKEVLDEGAEGNEKDN